MADKPKPSLPPPPDQQSAFTNMLSGIKGFFGMGDPSVATPPAPAPQSPAPLSPDAQHVLSILQQYPGAYYSTDTGHRISMSPLGYPEVTLPFGLGAKNYSIGGITQRSRDAANRGVYEMPNEIREILRSYGDDPAVVYSRNPDEATMRHERIHAGQRLSGYQNTTNEGILQRMLGNARQAGLLPPESIPAISSPNEIPAYSFADLLKYSPEDFAAYVDDVHMRAPRPWSLEASMPQPEMEKYLKTHPVPYNKKPLVKMKAVK